jgi:tetratricopeptide (TPR) repeat protein
MKRFIVILSGVVFLSVSTSYSQNKESLLAKISPSIVQLKTDIVIGNGVCIAPNKVVCQISVIGKYSYGQVMLPNGKFYRILGFTAIDVDNDMAVLKIDCDSATPIKMAAYPLVIGQKMYLTNKNDQGKPELTEARLNDIKDFGAVKLLEVYAGTQFKSGGLPVIDSLGNMIGISVMPPISDSNLNFASPADLIKKAEAKEDNLRKLDNLQPFWENLKKISFSSNHKSKAVSEFLDLGVLKINEKDYKGAIEKFNIAIRISPADADAYAFRGQAKCLLMQYKDALLDFNKALELQPDYAEVLDMRGVCKAELGDKKGACEDWKQSYENGYNPAFKMLEKYCDLE